jgi:hypothetical protein
MFGWLSRWRKARSRRLALPRKGANRQDTGRKRARHARGGRATVWDETAPYDDPSD